MANSEIKMSMSLATAGVKTSLDKVKAGIADFSARSMEKLKSVATFFKTGLVIGAGVFVGMKKSIEKLTDMARAADRLGVSTEMFQRLAFAAKQTGDMRAGKWSGAIYRREEGSASIVRDSRSFKRENASKTRARLGLISRKSCFRCLPGSAVQL